MLKFTIFLVGVLAIATALNLPQPEQNIPFPPIVLNTEGSDVQIQSRASSSCPLLYGCFRNRTYYFEGNTKRTRDDASYFCNSLGMTLVSVENCEENSFIVESIKRMNCVSSNFWTSGYQNGNKNWFWGSTGLPMNYTNWKFDEPNYKKKEYCVAYKKEYLQWADVKCSEKYNFICESNKKC